MIDKNIKQVYINDGKNKENKDKIAKETNEKLWKWTANNIGDEGAKRISEALCFKSKPALEPFETAVERLSKSSESIIKNENCVAIGDRYDMDIALPLEMGMGGILVSGVEEVYQIPENML